MVNMAKKVKKGIAGGPRHAGRRALFSKLLSFILSLFIIYSVFPTAVFGATNDYAKVDWTVYSPSEHRGSLYVSDTYNNTNIKLSSIRSIILGSTKYIEVNQNEKLDLTISLKSPDISAVGRCFFTDTNGFLDWTSGTEPSFKIPATFNKSSNSFSCSYIFENQKENKTGYYLIIYNPTFDNPSDSLSLCVSSYRSVVNSEEQNFFSDIKEWFSNLFELLINKFSQLGETISNFSDNVKKWFSDLGDTLSKFSKNVGDWFSNLSQSIQTFFSELKDKLTDLFNDIKQNLSDWFSDVGQWFADLVKNIKQLFHDLIDKITLFFDSAKEDITSWWNSVVNTLRSFFVPEDGYFEKYKQDWEDWAKVHFALFYDIELLFVQLLEIILDSLMHPTDLSITIPELQLPFLGNPVIMPETTFSFSTLLSHNKISFMYSVYIIVVKLIIFLLTINYAKKSFSEVLTGRGDIL